MMIAPLFCSPSSMRRTMIRSCRGLTSMTATPGYDEGRLKIGRVTERRTMPPATLATRPLAVTDYVAGEGVAMSRIDQQPKLEREDLCGPPAGVSVTAGSLKFATGGDRQASDGSRIRGAIRHRAREPTPASRWRPRGRGGDGSTPCSCMGSVGGC